MLLSDEDKENEDPEGTVTEPEFDRSENDEENIGMCFHCDKNMISFLIQLCGYILCFICGKRSGCKLCGRKILGRVFVSFDDS